MFRRTCSRALGLKSIAPGSSIRSWNTRRTISSFRVRTTLSTHAQPSWFSPLTLSGLALVGTFSCATFALLHDQIHSDELEDIDSQSYKRERVLDVHDFHEQIRALLASNLADSSLGDIFYSSQVISSQGYLRMICGPCLFPNGRTISYMAIFDGINGGEMSQWLQENAGLAMIGAMSDLYHETAEAMKDQADSEEEGDSIPVSDLEPSREAFHETMKATFLRLEEDLIPPDYTMASRNPEQVPLCAEGGASAMFAWYDPRTQLLRVANAGSCQAVLARQRKDSKGKIQYNVEIVSGPQTIQNDRAQFEAKHPGEFNQFNSSSPMRLSRVMGLGQHKWNMDMQEKLLEHRLGSPIPDYIRTPPYATAEPEISTLQIQKGDFLILGSQGFWESLTSDEAVGLVQLWLQNPKHSVQAGQAKDGVVVTVPTVDVTGFSKTISPKSLPHASKGTTDSTIAYKKWNAEKNFVDVDSSIATHLLRNALGGADQDLTRWLLTLQSPRSHAWRNDIAVGVAIF